MKHANYDEVAENSEMLVTGEYILKRSYWEFWVDNQFWRLRVCLLMENSFPFSIFHFLRKL